MVTRVKNTPIGVVYEDDEVVGLKAGKGKITTLDRFFNTGTIAGKVFNAGRYAPSFTPFNLTERIPYLNVLDLGVQRNTSTDQRAAILNAITIANKARCALYFPIGIYTYSAAMSFSVPVIGDGPDDSILYCTNNVSDYNGALNFTDTTGLFAYGIGRQHVSTPRGSASLSAGFLLNGVTNWWQSDCKVTGGATTGWMMEGIHMAAFQRIEAHNTMADGFHIRPRNVVGGRGSASIFVDSYVARGCGDDMFAVVSYTSDPTYSAGIFASNLDCRDQLTTGRGITVLGGADVVIDGFVIDNSVNAGLYLGSDGGNVTRGSSRVVVRNGTINNCGGGSALQGAIQMRFTATEPSNDILVENVTITQPRRHIGFVSGSTGGTSVTLKNLKCEGKAGFNGFDFAAIDKLTIEDLTISGAGQTGIYIANTCDNVVLKNITMSDLNSTGDSSHDGIRTQAASGTKNITLGNISLIRQNTLLQRLVENGTNWAVTLLPNTSRTAKYVASGVSATISGYTDTSYIKTTY